MSGVRKRKRRVKKTSDFWSLPDGKRLHEQHKNGLRTTLPAGCGVFTLPPEDLTSMRTLCETILERLPILVPWGDGWTDQKGRGYAMLSNLSDFPDVQSVVANGILMHDVDSALCTDASVRSAATVKHNYTVDNAFVSMDPPQPQIDAIQHLIDQVNSFLQDPINSPHLQSYERDAVRLSNLVAIQPNFHNGDDYLPLHLDNPRHDGFGVVIVTVALWGSADVVLVDDGDAEDFIPSPQKSVVLGNDSVRGIGEERLCQESGSVDTKVVVTPPCCEGGIVFRDGAYHVTNAEENTGAAASTVLFETTHSLGLAVADNTPSQTTSPTIGEDLTNNVLTTSYPADTTMLAMPSALPCTCVPLRASLTNTTVTHDINNHGSNNDNFSNCTTPVDPAANPTENASSTTSWVFPLHPGQCYVLSGPARNKCAHGIVVHPVAAPVEGTKKKHTEAEENTTPATINYNHATSNTSTNTSNMTDTTNTTCTSSKIESGITSGCISSTPATTEAITEMQPKEWKGRVSLNFRFGIHTPEQAWHEIDRHWT